MTGEQSDSYNSVVSHETLHQFTIIHNLTHVSLNACKGLKCQAFRPSIGWLRVCRAGTAQAI